MKSIIIDICLSSLLALNLQASAGEKVESRMTEIAKKKAEVRKVLGEIRGRVLLDRSANEFFDEMGLFDNQLYGRLRSQNHESRMNEIKTNIETMNNQLQETLGRQTGITDGEEGTTFSNDETFSRQVQQLESQIDCLKGELGVLQAVSLLNGGTELLEGSNFDRDEQPGRVAVSFKSLSDSLEYYLKILESLEQEEKKLEKKGMDRDK